MFNNQWAFEQLSDHLEFEALQSNDTWLKDHKDALNGVADYQIRCVELVTAFKEGAAIYVAMAVDEDGRDDDVMKSILLLKMHGQQQDSYCKLLELANC